mgnify:CR=1 FL=1
MTDVKKFAYQHYFMRKKFRMIFHRPAVIFQRLQYQNQITKINDTEYTTSQVYYSWNGKKYTKTKLKGVYEYIPNNENYNLKITIKDGNENNISILNKYFKKANIIK